ncbi:putative histone-lysine N-methyltransferase PRDM7 [Frankliniella fusca]|uniref:Histone-lysine N-methyltransferase PRDM7 n=1 Tax=Frankliniella fusca TaxID=407009 RepID=A0AAE1LF50_9NEOP|nr:putative histone-lysine N-methyltransferase PRDM7 [Frankliniella fusca]
MSESDTGSDFEDIEEFFSNNEWKELGVYEKHSYRNMRKNFLAMQACGLSPKLPIFMRKKVQKPVRDPAGLTNKQPVNPTAKEAPRRNPQRKNSRKVYAEPDDDDLLYYTFFPRIVLDCFDCQAEWEGDCPEHGPLQFIAADTEVAVGHPERALLTVPAQLAVSESKISGAGLGVWARHLIPKRVCFGPYDSEVVPIGKNTGYGWEIQRGGKAVHCVDAVNMASSNWMRFVNCARHSEEQNLHAYQHRGQLFYQTMRDILPDEELLVWDGDTYAQELKIDGKVYNEAMSSKDQRLLSEYRQLNRFNVCSAMQQKKKGEEQQVAAVSSPPEAGARRHTCGSCGRNFLFPAHLKRHEQEVHGKEKAQQVPAVSTPNIGVFQRQDLAFSEDANILASKDANQFTVFAMAVPEST